MATKVQLGGFGNASSPEYDLEGNPIPASGGTGGGSGGPVGAGDIVGTCDTAVRLGFLRKVYAILTLNFLITVLFSCFCLFVPAVRTFVITNYWLSIVGYIFGIGAYIALVCIKVRPPTSTILLALFIAGFSLMIGTICATYYASGMGAVIAQAFIATFLTFAVITVYINVTKKDFSFLGGFLIAGTVILIVMSLLTFATAMFTGATKGSRWLYFAVSVFGALLTVGYLLYDTSLVVNKLGPDDVILAVIMLYTDVSTLFLYLLSILSSINQ